MGKRQRDDEDTAMLYASAGEIERLNHCLSEEIKARDGWKQDAHAMKAAWDAACNDLAKITAQLDESCVSERENWKRAEAMTAYAENAFEHGMREAANLIDEEAHSAYRLGMFKAQEQMEALAGTVRTFADDAAWCKAAMAEYAALSRNTVDPAHSCSRCNPDHPFRAGHYDKPCPNEAVNGVGGDKC